MAQPASPQARILLDSHCRITRVTDPGQGAVLIKHSGVDEHSPGLANERAILTLLQGIPGCPVLVEKQTAPDELRMRDTGGILLGRSELPGHLEIDRFLRIAESLARSIAGIHGQRVIHQAIQPDHILIHPEDLSATLINFDKATRFPLEALTSDVSQFPPDALRYASPEQTGRLLRMVDYRSDLYALGATLYFTAAGTPPFDDDDVLGLIHAHLAREPRPLHERVEGMPEPVSRVIHTLLAKEPDQRYQSAWGLLRDVQALRQALKQGSPLENVSLRALDLPLMPRRPHRVHGRNQEITVLQNTFAATRLGGRHEIFIAGPSGVGKTSLVLELSRTIEQANGRFIKGKFDQYQRDQVLLGPVQSLRHLCRLLLADPEVWVPHLQGALKNDIGALFGVIPDLQLLMGFQPGVEPLDPIQNMVRLRRLLVGLIRAVATPGQPLVMFLDDLQWADQPSLDFIAALLQETTLAGFFLIGAYRDNEIDSTHPLTRILNVPGTSGALPEVLTLANLSATSVPDMLGDMLHVHGEDTGTLASLLCEKTGGNPYFIIEFMQGIFRNGLLRPDTERGRWEWDNAGISSYPSSENIVSFLIEDLGRTPGVVTDLLITMACLGDACTLECLELATGCKDSELLKALTPALERGVLSTPRLPALQQGESEIELRFCHDRMRQAVYQLRGEPWHLRTHLSMARRFDQYGTSPEYEIRAAEHYALAIPLIVDPAESDTARRLFVIAARQARQAGAFSTAERFVRLAIEQLCKSAGSDTVEREGDVWSINPDAACELYTELHLLLYSQARYAESDEIFSLISQHSRVSLSRVELTCVQTISLCNRTLYEESTRLVAEAVAALGTTMPLDDPMSALAAELALVDPYLIAADASGNGLLPRRRAAADPCLSGLAKLINRAISPTFFSNPLLALWITIRAARLWIEHGYQEYFLYPVTCITTAYIAMRDDYRTGYVIGKAALEIGTAIDNGPEAARAQHIFGLVNCHWHQPLSDCLEYARSAFEALMRGGELEFACFTHYTSLAAVAETCSNLSELEAEAAVALGFARKHGNRHSEESFLPFQCLTQALRDTTNAHGSFDHAGFDEAGHLARIRHNHMACAYFHAYRALAAAIYNEPDGLGHHAGAAHALIPFILSFYPASLIHTVQALALIQQIARSPDEDHSERLQQLNGELDWLTARAFDAPINFGHLNDWLQAERLNLLGDPCAALRLFEQAISKALAHQRPLHHALITERAALCYLGHGMERAGRALLTQAHELYEEWGAHGKVTAMCKTWPFLGRALSNTHQHETVDSTVDYHALLDASQALAAERSLPSLIDRLVTLLSQLTGATDVRLLYPDARGDWYLEGGMRGEQRLQRMSMQEAHSLGIISAIGVGLAMKNLKPVLSEDAVVDARFAGDPHFAGLPQCSLLGLPIFSRGEPIAFLALENRLLRGAFASTHIAAVTLLASQLAISLENARVYQTLEDKVAEREQQILLTQDKLMQLAVEQSQMQERERLLQDMHDGFGSQLASARLQVEQGRLDPDRVSTILKECMDDLHLIADTLSTPGKTLSEALVDYRWRLQNRLLECPVKLTWQLDLDMVPPLSQRQILDSLRLLQEAIQNALKHAQASHIQINAGYQPQNHVVISIQDDGIGLADDITHGHGLHNMERRTRSLNGTIAFDRTDPGTTVTLTFPVTASDPALAEH